jgi:hypothetical protein
MDYEALAKQFGGVVVSAPTQGGVDYAALAKEFGGTEDIPLYEVSGRALASAPGSAAKFAGDIYTAVTNPVQTVTGLADLAAGGLRAGAKAALPAQVFQFIDQIDNPETTKRISDVANAVGGQLAQDYGSYEGIKRKIATDPVAFFADASTLLTGGALATARVAPGVSNVLARGAAATDPLLQTARAGAGGVNALRSAAANVPNPREMINTALRPYVDPDAAAVNRFIQSVEDPAAAAAGLRATQNAFVTPGAPSLSAAERLVEAGVPSLGAASLEQGLAASSPQVAQQMRARELGQQSAIQQQLARVEQQIQTQAATLAPADLSQLRTVRDSLLRELADERLTLANTAQGVAQPLPTVSQQQVGAAIQQRGAQTAETFKKEVVQPAFRAAFDADAPTPSIDLSRPLGSAERLLGDIGTIVDPSTVSPAVRNLLKIEPYEPSLGIAPVVSLEDFQSIRSALNTQLRAAEKVDPQRAGALKNVLGQMNEALKTSGVPAEAQQLYRQALGVVREQQVPRFRTGATGRMLSTTRFNMPGTLPSRQVEAFLKTEDAASQFVRTFEGDPKALQSMQQGVLDLYRRKIVDPTTRAVDPKEAAKFEADYARQLDTLEAAGLNVRETMSMVQRDAVAVQRGLETLASEAKKFRRTPDAAAVVDLALKSPMDMRFVRDRLSPTAREALSGELVNRATTLIEQGDAAGALSYLTKNERALKVGLGKEGAKTYRDLRELADLQKQFLDVTARAPKTDALTPVTLSKQFTPAELTDLQVVAKDIARTRGVEELGAPKDKGAGKIASEAALEAGASPSRIPGLFMPIITASKSALKSILDIQDRRVAAALFDRMVKDPDSLIPLLEEAARAKGAATPRQQPRPLTIPRGVTEAARAGTVAGAAQSNMMSSQENRNAMVR